MFPILLSLGDAGATGEFFAAWLSFILIAVSSSQVARIFPLLKLPLITGYLFFGVLCGPYILHLLSKDDLDQLTAITQVALAFISLSAGAELYLPELRALFKRIIAITTWLTCITFIACTIIIFVLAIGGLIPGISHPIDPSLPDLGGGCKFSISMVAATIMVTQSPASTIAIVRELGAKGPFTSTMLGVTVLCDVIVLFLFSVTASITASTCIASLTEGEAAAPLGMGYSLLITIACIFMAVVLGYALGKLIIFLIWLPSMFGEIFVLPLGFACFRFTEWFMHYSAQHYGVGINFDPLLICIVAGYVTSNHSRNRRKFLKFLGKAGPIVFIPFFTLTGAGLNLPVMGKAMGFAIIVFITRALCFASSVQLSACNTHLPDDHKKTLWASMLTQAGVSLGIASEVAIQFPEWGRDFQSVIIAVVLINQLFGPVLCKWALKRAGEAGKGGEEEEDEHHGLRKRAIFIGLDQYTLSLAQRLLYQNWNIMFLDWSQQRLDTSRYLIVPKEDEHDGEHASAPAPAPAPAPEKSVSASVPQVSQSHVEPEGSPMQEASPEPASELGSPDAEADAEADVDAVGSDTTSPTPLTRQPTTSDGIDESASFAAYAAEHAVSDEVWRAQRAAEEEAHQREIRIQTRVIALDEVIRGGYEDDDVAIPVAQREMSSARSGTHTPRRLDEHDLSNPYIQHQITQGIARITTDLNTMNTTSVIVMLDNDMLTYHICQYLVEQLQLVHVQALIHNPAWVSLFVTIGVTPIWPFSITTHTLLATTLAGASPHAGILLGGIPVNKKQTLTQALASLITTELSAINMSPTLNTTLVEQLKSGLKSPSMDSLRNATAQASLAFAHLTEQERFQLFQRYPDPPSYVGQQSYTQQNRQLLGISERVQVETYAMRDDYLSSIDTAHNNLHIPINLTKNSQASHVTFASPMLYGNDDDDDDSKIAIPVRQSNVR